MHPRSLRQLLKDVVPVNQQFRQRGGTHGTGLDVGPGQLVLLVRAERVGQNGLLAGVGDPILPNVVFGVQVEFGTSVERKRAGRYNFNNPVGGSHAAALVYFN